MEINSSGEELVVKNRKPYTITKQRERWTEKEHNRFLEALKLHGRAWQRIEDHIGTKTAVQIRSHAQKFFTKLEKESVAKGSHAGQAHDIDIPPPRPKRKRNSPYPRKSGACCVPATAEAVDETASKSISSQETTKEDLILLRNAATGLPAATKSVQGMDVCSDGGNCSVVLSLFQETPTDSVSFGYEGSTNPVSLKEFVPIAVNEHKEVSSAGGSSLSFEISMEPSTYGRNKPDQVLEKINGISKNLHALQKSSALGELPEVQMESVKPSQIGIQNDADKSNSNVLGDTVEFPSSAFPFLANTMPSAPGLQHGLALSSIPPPFVTFPQFAQFHDPQGLYRSFLDISSSFYSLIISTLLRNSAVHVAAQMAASLLPSGEMGSLTDSGMASVARETVAAAASWWASNGLLPLFPHAHASGVLFPLQTNSNPVENTCLFPCNKPEEGLGSHHNSSRRQDVNPEGSLDFKIQPSPPRSVLFSSDSEEIEIEPSTINTLKQITGSTAHQNGNNEKVSQKTEHSSCGSNAPSSSEVETNAALNSNPETNIGAQEVQFETHPLAEINGFRARSSRSMNDSWKEVSQEGRVAFQALFARDVLPQTFSRKIERVFPPGMPMERENVNQNDLPPNGNLKVRQTGFKPYKRCSAEVEVNRSSANDESSNKRIHLEGKASRR